VGGATNAHSRKNSINAGKPARVGAGPSGPTSCKNTDKPKLFYDTADGFCKISNPQNRAANDKGDKENSKLPEGGA